MAGIRSIVRSIKAVLFFLGFGLELVVLRPRTRVQRAAWLHRFCAAMIRGFGIVLTVEGEFPKGGVLISNHTGYLDILAYAAMSDVVFCAKAEMEKWPLLGWMAMMAGSVFIDRGAGGSSERAKAGMEAAEKEGVPVLFYPEGTTSNGLQVLPFRSGLIAVSLEAKQPITAAYIRYTLDKDNGPGVSVADNVSFWGDDVNMLTHIYTLLGIQGIHAWVKIAPEPIQFSPAALEDRKVAAFECREAVLAVAGIASDVPAEEPVLHQK